MAAAAANGEVDDMTALVLALPPDRSAPVAPLSTARPTSFTLQETEGPRDSRAQFTWLLLGLVLILTIVAVYLFLTAS